MAFGTIWTFWVTLSSEQLTVISLNSKTGPLRDVLDVSGSYDMINGISAVSVLAGISRVQLPTFPLLHLASPHRTVRKCILRSTRARPASWAFIFITLSPNMCSLCIGKLHLIRLTNTFSPPLLFNFCLFPLLCRVFAQKAFPLSFSTFFFIYKAFFFLMLYCFVVICISKISYLTRTCDFSLKAKRMRVISLFRSGTFDPKVVIYFYTKFSC